MILKFFRPRGRRIRRRIIWGSVAAALCLLVWLAPAVVGSRFVWPKVVGYVTADFPGHVATGGASLGWLSPVEVRAVAIDDANGQQLAKIGTLRTQASLLALLWHSSDLGVVHIERPQISLQVRRNGSNVEDALASILARQSSSNSVKGTIEIIDGSVRIFGEGPSTEARIEQIQAQVQLPSSEHDEGTARLVQCKVSGGNLEGSCTADVSWQLGSDTARWSVATHMETIGLSLVALAARRFGQEVRLDGALTADMQCAGDSQQHRLTIDIRRADLQPLRLVAPAWLGQDVLAFQTVSGKGTCAWSDGSWNIAGAEVACDAGRFTIDGQFAWPPQPEKTLPEKTLPEKTLPEKTLPETSLWRNIVASAAAASVKMEGNIDLARLARSLPHTMRIREGAEIEAGTIQFQFSGSQQVDGRSWLARLETSDLSARRDGRRFTWKDPLRLNLKAAQTTDGWSVQHLEWRSPFMNLSGEGTQRRGSFELQCNLDKLVSELQQFVDLGMLRAVGMLTTRLNWQLGEDGRASIAGDGLIENLELTTAAGTRFQEPRLTTTLNVEGNAEGSRLTHVRSARVELESATDRFELQLLEPVTNPNLDTVWTLGCHLAGQGSSWLSRFRTFLPNNQVDVSGAMQLETIARLSRHAVEMEKAALQWEPFQLTSPQLHINEPVIAINLDGRWDMDAGQWSISAGTFRSAAVAFRVSDAAFRPSGGQPRVTGSTSFRADLAQLQSSWQMPTRQQDWRMSGVVQGQLSLAQAAALTHARWSMDVVGAEISRRESPAGSGTASSNSANIRPATSATVWKSVWKEPSLKLSGAGQYDAEADSVQLERFELTSADELKLSMDGSIAQPLARCSVDVQGRVTYDLARLVERVLPDWRSSLQVAGQDTQAFSLRGPLFHAVGNSPGAGAVASGTVASGSAAPVPSAAQGGTIVPIELAGQGGLRWQSADVLGVPIGGGSLSARLQAGTIETGTIEMPFSQGTLRIIPHLYLGNPSPLLTVDPGRVLSNVSISPEMCQGWLKYIAPLAADATRAEGQFSLTLQGASVPIDRPDRARVQGVLAIQGARVGPGPLALQWLYLGEQIKAVLQRRLPSNGPPQQVTWVTLPEQSTQFHLVDGRVHHDRMELLIGDVVVRTRGSVGLDQTLSLVAQVPIRDQWVAGDPRLSRLNGQVVEVPISGTFSSPRLDRNALERLSAQLIQNAAGRLLENEVNKGLQQLFGPGR